MTTKTTNASRVVRLDRAHEELAYALEAARAALQALDGNDPALVKAIELLAGVRGWCRAEADRLDG